MEWGNACGAPWGRSAALPPRMANRNRDRAPALATAGQCSRAGSRVHAVLGLSYPGGASRRCLAPSLVAAPNALESSHKVVTHYYIYAIRVVMHSADVWVRSNRVYRDTSTRVRLQISCVGCRCKSAAPRRTTVRHGRRHAPFSTPPAPPGLTRPSMTRRVFEVSKPITQKICSRSGSIDSFGGSGRSAAVARMMNCIARHGQRGRAGNAGLGGRKRRCHHGKHEREDAVADEKWEEGRHEGDRHACNHAFGTHPSKILPGRAIREQLGSAAPKPRK